MHQTNSDNCSDNGSFITIYNDCPDIKSTNQDIVYKLSLISDYVKNLEEKRRKTNFSDDTTHDFLQQSEELESKLKSANARCRAVEKNLAYLKTLRCITCNNKQNSVCNIPTQTDTFNFQNALPLKPPNQPLDFGVKLDDRIMAKFYQENGFVSPAFIIRRLGNYQKVFMRDNKIDLTDCENLVDTYKNVQKKLNRLAKKISHLQWHVNHELDPQTKKRFLVHLEYFKNEESNKQAQLKWLHKFLGCDPRVNHQKINSKSQNKNQI